MANQAHNQMPQGKPSEKPAVLATLNTILALVGLATAVLAVGIYIWKLDAKVDNVNLAVIGVQEKAIKIPPRITALEYELSKVPSDVGQRIAALENGLSRVPNDIGQRLSELETRLSEVPDVSPLLKRFPDVETRLSMISAYLASARFDTVYVFKHTFDFPNPMFNIGDDTDFLACPSDTPEVDWQADMLLDLERKRYQTELAMFDDHIEFNFYTTSDEPTTIIRQEIACYKQEFRTNKETLISPAPVKVRMQIESAADSDDNYGTLVISDAQIGFDHEDSDLMTYPLRRKRDAETDRQVHKLIATLDDREVGEGNCAEYKRQAAAGGLDRCDFEVFVFAYDSPPFATREE